MKFVISDRLESEVQERLSFLGIGEANTYPSLDGVAKILKFEYFNEISSDLGSTPTLEEFRKQANDL